MPRRRKRGYPVAVLVGLDPNRATLWNIYNESVKLYIKIKKESEEFNFYEDIINYLRPQIKQGIKTIIITSKFEKTYQSFYDHIEKHQRWLIAGYELNRVTFEYVEGSARDHDSVVELIEKSGLKRTVTEATRKDFKRVMSVLEKRLGTPEGIDALRFSINEVENAIYNDDDLPEYILMTTEFQKNHRRRTQRIIQIAQNKKETRNHFKQRKAEFFGIMWDLFNQYKSDTNPPTSDSRF